jgi:hypothetical protein
MAADKKHLKCAFLKEFTDFGISFVDAVSFWVLAEWVRYRWVSALGLMGQIYLKNRNIVL